MGTPADPDLPVGRFKPDRELLARAFNAMLASEGAEEKFVRQRWEEALGATNVALAAAREVYPSQSYSLSREALRSFREAVHYLESVLLCFNGVEAEMTGVPMQMVAHGLVTTVEGLEGLDDGQA